ncbi:NAD(P)-dependent oxidoreductase [Gleimia hominis]|uniref:NAD(P)-dependent oxidoreductase n=1 Tax=Gleimia hominis TaxID=595468 RepID=A0ABU3I8T9_9ACTO|nr:NAD(P)-dependent oxidoreductase [Gleimia hominis]MDT3766795.1 NAD(P)-dependent oxidoreductase [Gleimia hominis]
MSDLIAFGVRPDEKTFFEQYGKEHGHTIRLIPQALNRDNVGELKGYEGVCALESIFDEALLADIHANGTKYIALRSVGYDSVDENVAKQLGIKVSNSSYSPSSVAEFAVMLILMTMRKARQITRHSDIQDFSLNGLDGHQLSNSTVGIIGAGNIGATVARCLSGFGCEILAYDPYPNESLKNLVEYVELDELLRRSDVITLHTLYTGENYHMLGEREFNLMKNGVCLVNCARGELIDGHALIDALKSGKIMSAALDVVEGDQPLFNSNWNNKPIQDEIMRSLRSFPNVTITPHIAFYTANAVKEMVDHALDNLIEFMNTTEATNRVI